MIFQMLVKIKLLSISLLSGFALLFMLCLGAQNLNDRHNLKIGQLTTAPLPTGFLIGVSIVLGVISGGTTATLLIPPPDLNSINN